MSRKRSIKRDYQDTKSYPKKRPVRPITNIEVKQVTPKTAGQEKVLEAIHDNSIVLLDSIAGTGKSHLAFGSALHYRTTDRRIKRIILVRPTVSAGDGDDLGFLPGSLEDKMSPFLAPFMKDILPSLVSCDTGSSPSEYQAFVQDFLIGLNIEVVPFQFMRGRTFSNAFVVLSESQNCSKADFKLFLSRIGKDSKVVIEGDSSQSDIGRDSWFIELQGKLEGLEDVKIVTMDESDIVRNPLIGKILRRIG